MPAAAESQQLQSGTNVATSEEGRFNRDLLLNILEQVKKAIREQQLYHGQRLIRRTEAERNTFFVPQEANLNRLLRYGKQELVESDLVRRPGAENLGWLDELAY